MEFTRRRRRHTHNAIAPLVDVVFLLLLFFVLTFHILPERAMQIDLPQSETAAGQVEQGIVVTLFASGRVLVNDREVPLAELRFELGRIHGADPGGRVRIEADRAVDVGRLIAAVDAVKGAGYASFDLITRQK